MQTDDKRQKKSREAGNGKGREMEGACAYWLYSLPSIGNKGIRKLLDEAKSPSKLYERFEEISKRALGESLREKALRFTEGWRLQEEYEELEKKEIRFVYEGCGEYPWRLAGIPDAPYGMFVKGRLPEQNTLTVALVGARECTAYGAYVAQATGACLGERKIAVISGMARGIDGIAQRAALEAGGYSLGVLGCGVDVCYPADCRDLYGQLEKKGGLLSLVPPGAAPRPSLFPPRNRIVSGMADAVLVIEARSRSGTLITVDMALEQGREVYAVPGRVTDRPSDGCNRLLEQGAGVFLSPESFVRELTELFPDREAGIRREKADEKQSPGERADLSKEEKGILRAVDLCPVSVQEILDRLPHNYDYRQVQSVLMKLCVKGEISQVSQGYFALSGIQPHCTGV